MSKKVLQKFHIFLSLTVFSGIAALNQLVELFNAQQTLTY